MAGALLLASVAYVYGIVSYHYEPFPYHLVKRLIDVGSFSRVARYGGYDVTFDRVEVPCGVASQGAMVLLTLGQSNSANSSDGCSNDAPNVYNFNLFDGRCYEARDPLLGAGGDGGSLWLPLANLLIERGVSGKVVIAPIGLGGSRAADWAPGGPLNARVAAVLAALARADVAIDAVLWQQGESDHTTDPAAYTASFLSLVDDIRARNVLAPIYVAQSTQCDGVVSGAIRAAQAQLVAQRPDLRAGPDTDILSSVEMRNGCHFTRRGAMAGAELWFAVLQTTFARRSDG
jgi:hypothetical protein